MAQLGRARVVTQALSTQIAEHARALLWERGDLAYKMHAGQVELRTQFYSAAARVTVWNIARRFGKSTDLVILAIEHALKTHLGRVVFAAPTREQARDIVSPIFRHVLEDCPPHLRPRYNEARNFYTFESTGCEIHIDGADDERGARLRGTKATLVLGDEVGFWRYPVEVIKSVLLPQTITCNGRIIIASTPPESPHHAFWQLVAEARIGGSYEQRTIYQNPMVTPALIEEYMRESGGQDSSAWRREYLCERVAEVERAVIPEFKPDIHIGEYERPAFYDGYVSLDLGLVDLSHCLFAHYDFANACVVVENEVVRQYCTVSELAPEIYAMERETWGNQAPRTRVSDAQAISLAEFSRQHVLQPQLVPRETQFASAQNREPEALINRTRAMFASKRIKIHPRCKNLIAQVEGGLWNAKRTDFERIPGLGHLDGLMALVYLVDAVDYQSNPAWREKLNPETHATYYAKTPTTQRYSQLAKMLPPSARRGAK